jgi:hypothetical protein
MEHFVTLFDSTYLPQGLALHKSMERHVKDYCLWILCVDERTYEVLTELDLNRTELLALKDFETDELLAVKNDRTIAEYCWTLTPFAPRFVFEADNSVQRVTYLDADIWFRKDPGPIFRELDDSGKSLLITDHAYAPEYDQSATSGQFCVQFMPFERDVSEPVRKWWEERCLEWCYARLEDGKFGDQKYLDDWPERFERFVHVLQDRELLLAPWNANKFPIGRAVAFHFHGVRVSRKKLILTGRYFLPRNLYSHLFVHYFEDIRSGIYELRQIGFAHTSQLSTTQVYLHFLGHIRVLVRRLWPMRGTFRLSVRGR